MSQQGYFQPAIQTQAAWDADDEVYGKFTLMLVSDGANSNKFKLADGVSTFAELDYFTSGGGGGSGLTVDELAAIVGATPIPNITNVFLTATSAINNTTGSNGDIDDAISDAFALEAINRGKVYVALVSTEDPVVYTEIRNELGGVPAWAADGIGLSTVTITGAFPVGLTAVEAILTDTGTPGLVSSKRVSANAVQIATWALDTTPTTMQVTLTIRVYPA